MNITDIVEAILAYSDRADAAFASSGAISTFLRTVESKINRIPRIDWQTVRAYTTTDINTEYYGVPVGFNGMRDLMVRPALDSNTRVSFDFVPPDTMNAYINAGDHKPVYTIIGTSIHIWPKYDNYILEMIYYTQITPLTAVAPTNWLSIYYPDVYIAGALVELFLYVKDSDSAAIWEEKFKAGISEMITEDAVDRWSGPAPAMRIA